jgi:hypothetical protein
MTGALNSPLARGGSAPGATVCVDFGGAGGCVSGFMRLYKTAPVARAARRTPAIISKGKFRFIYLLIFPKIPVNSLE